MTPGSRPRPTPRGRAGTGDAADHRRRDRAGRRPPHLRRALAAAAVLAGAAGAGLVATAGPGAAAGSLTVAPGFGAYAPAADWPSSSMPVATTFAVTGLVSGGDGTVGSVQVTGQPASGTATASGTSVVYTPASGTTGTQVVAITVCDTSSPAACGSSTVTFAPPVHTTILFTCPNGLSGTITQVVGMAEQAPASVLQGATFTAAQAAEPSHPPASFQCSGTTATVQDITDIDAVVPVPAGATYVAGTASLSGGDPTTDANTALLYCTGTGTPAAIVPSSASGSCSAQSGTANYPAGTSSTQWQTTDPYFELVTALPSGSSYTPSDTIDEPTVTATFTATGATGTQVRPALTEFDTYGSASAYGLTQSAWLYGAPQQVTPIATTAIGSLPAVTSLAPSSGPTTGGTSVTISGSGFTGASAVDFGSTAATSFTVGSDTSVTATAPPGSAGTVDVTVTNGQGTSATGSGDRFTYLAAPQVTAISPTSGPGGGGTVVTVTGSGFTGATAVSFGQAPAASFTVQSDTSLTATSPPAATGTVDITVTNAAGTSAATAADQYTTTSPPPAPTVTGVQPASGSTAGGTRVTVTGTSFTAGTTVAFGGVAATSVTVDGPGTLTALSPPAATGPVDVTVTAAGGTSPTSSADVFTYQPSAPQAVAAAPPGPPTITGVTAGPDRLTLAFTPGAPGGAATTGYRAACTAADGTGGSAAEPVPASSPGTTDGPQPVAVTGLLAGTTYRCTVTASSPAGTSAPSAPVAGTPGPPGGAPAAPAGVAVVAADGGATLRWSPPATNVVAYLVAVSPACPACTGVLVPGDATATAVVGLPNDAAARLRVAAVGPSGTIGALSAPVVVTPQAGAGCPGTGRGLWLAHWNGAVTGAGEGPGPYGSMAGHRLAAAVAGLVPAPGCRGYWEFGADGGVFAFGSARYLGGERAAPADPVVGMAATPDGRGYWLVTATGSVRAFGNAVEWGRTSPAAAPGDRVVAILASPDGRGFRLVTDSGSEITYGDAVPYQASGPAPGAGAVVAVAGTPDGSGNWLLTAAGTIRWAGDAPPEPGPGRPPAPGGPWTALAADPTGGLWAVDAAGTVVPLGGAPALTAEDPPWSGTPAWAAVPR